MFYAGVKSIASEDKSTGYIIINNDKQITLLHLLDCNQLQFVDDNLLVIFFHNRNQDFHMWLNDYEHTMKTVAYMSSEHIWKLFDNSPGVTHWLVSMDISE